VPLHFTAFHPAFKMLDVPQTPPKTVIRAREIALKNGIRYAFTGNISDIKGSSTYCHHCHERIIERSGYTISEYHLNAEGLCAFCKTKCNGVFEKTIGTWSGARQPIVMKGKQHG
jgi:pyruvate formate lyase activating enzyme